MKIIVFAAAAAAVLLSGPAGAAVVEVQPNGFALRHAVQIKAAPEKVWATLVDVGGWWSPAHTYSGDARNLSLEAKAGGCWCETLKTGGSVRHLAAVYVDPGKTLRLEGGLGPLQTTGGAGHLTFILTPSDGGTALTVAYVFGGYTQGGFDKLASPVDGVLAEQVGRLAAAAEK